MMIITINNTRRSHHRTLTDGTCVCEYNMGFILSVKKTRIPSMGLSIFYANPRPLDILWHFTRTHETVNKPGRASIKDRSDVLRSLRRFKIVYL